MTQINRTGRGMALMEVMVTGVIVAAASLGAAVALISGLSLEAKSGRTMSEVATAENVLARMRHTSESNFPALHSTYDGSIHASRESIGLQDIRTRPLSVSMPLAEASVPGSIDLDGDAIVGLA